MFTEKLFKCRTSDKRFSSKSNLNQHTKIHEEIKAFKCDVCFKAFNQKSNLTQHYKTHTGEKPFSCQVCDKSFARKDILVQHQATHSDVRSFKCSICPEGRSFKTKNQLGNHMVYHYEPKFTCSRCYFKAHISSNLKKHEKSHLK